MSNRRGGAVSALHERSIGKSQVHLTPRWVLDALGPFDLDPCAATVRPWDCALRNLTEADDGLSADWGRSLVWLNPPFDRRQIGAWVGKLAGHGHGLALVHARTETAWFKEIWNSASLILFLGRRVSFCRPDGELCTGGSGRPVVKDSGAPVVLAAFGETAAERLRTCGLPGAYVAGDGVRLAA